MTSPPSPSPLQSQSEAPQATPLPPQPPPQATPLPPPPPTPAGPGWEKQWVSLLTRKLDPLTPLLPANEQQRWASPLTRRLDPPHCLHRLFFSLCDSELHGGKALCQPTVSSPHDSEPHGEEAFHSWEALGGEGAREGVVWGGAAGVPCPLKLRACLQVMLLLQH